MHIDQAIKEELKKYLAEKIDQNKRRVTIISAAPITDQDMTEIKNKFQYLSTSRIDTIVNRDILAGFIIKFGTKMIDLSLKKKLEDVDRMMRSL